MVLPAPLGPSNPKISPRFTSKEVWFTATKSPKFFTRSLTSMITSGSRGCSLLPFTKGSKWSKPPVTPVPLVLVKVWANFKAEPFLALNKAIKPSSTVGSRFIMVKKLGLNFVFKTVSGRAFRAWTSCTKSWAVVFGANVMLIRPATGRASVTCFNSNSSACHTREGKFIGGASSYTQP